MQKRWKWNFQWPESSAMVASREVELLWQLLSLPWVLMSDRLSRCSCCRLRSLCRFHAIVSVSPGVLERLFVLCSCWKVKETQGVKHSLAPKVWKFRKNQQWRRLGHWWQNEQRATQKLRKSVSETGRGGEGKCKDLTGNQTINLFRVWKKHISAPQQWSLFANDSAGRWQQSPAAAGKQIKRHRCPFPWKSSGQRWRQRERPAQAQKQPVSSASLPAPHASRACFPRAQGDVLSASLAGAVPLSAQGSSPGVSGHLMVESRWERKNERTEENRVSGITVPGRRSSGFSQGFKGFSLKHLFY